MRQGVALDLSVPEALDPDVEAPFKGDMDVDALGELLDGPDGERISIVMLTITYNTGDGQPVSLANVREVAALFEHLAEADGDRLEVAVHVPSARASGRRGRRDRRRPRRVSGLELVAESPVLRHFTARFKSLTAVAR